jgi:hypothetical protein
MTESLDAHVARVLLLVDTFSSTADGLDGLTKLAKLDFLVRYPVFLEALDLKQGIQDPNLKAPRDVDRAAVESPMMRYKYGPWDGRYYAVVGALVGRGLAEYVPGRGRVALRVSDEGRGVAQALRRLPNWADIDSRLQHIHEYYDVPGSRLKSMIYETFPQLVEQRIGSRIDASPQGLIR